MKSLFQLFLYAAIGFAITACTSAAVQPPTTRPPPSSAGSSLHAVFEGITPCSAQSRALPQIPKDSDCELMIWKIIFYQDAATGTPTTYLLESLYGASQPNSMGPAGGGTSIVMEGNWSVTKGAKTAPEADVYQLHAEDPQVVASFVKMSDDILHILNPDKTLMVGNAAWSYTLNRTDNRPPITMDVPVSSGPEVTRPPIPTMPPGAAVLAVYEGRSPCHEIVFEILKVAPYPNCLKVKSQLTLYQDQQTGVPTTYMYLGTSTIREGTWTTLEGTKDDPHADVYQLHLEGSKEPVFFLKADENHLFLLDRDLNLLVGNALFSYTLSKIEKDTK